MLIREASVYNWERVAFSWGAGNWMDCLAGTEAGGRYGAFRINVVC